MEFQAATSEVLRLMVGAGTDVQPVLDAIAEHSTRLCRGEFSAVFHFDGELIHLASHHGLSREAGEIWEQIFPRPAELDTAIGRAIATRTVAHIPDVTADQTYGTASASVAQAVNFRCIVGVPMVRDRIAIGGIVVARPEAVPFSNEQLELLKTFADQAAIAIESVRLFRELDSRNRDLTDALEYQTATSEVLRLMAAARTDIQPVLDTIAARSARLCDGQFCTVFRFDGELIHLAGHYGLSPDAFETWKQVFPRPPGPDTVIGRAIESRSVAHVPDVQADPDYGTASASVAEALKYRCIVGTPMLYDGEPIGGIIVAKTEPEPFTDRQLELLGTFADQAVIAVEGVRLSRALETRTHELARSVDELKALNDISQAVSSTLDSESVLSTVVAHAVKLTAADSGAIYQYDQASDEFRFRAAHNMGAATMAALRVKPIRMGEGAVGRAALRQAPYQIPDVLEGDRYDARLREVMTEAGVRAVLAVPLIREEETLGAIVVRRKHPGPFAEEMIRLVQTFAGQSTLAIQNARLFEQTKEMNRELSDALDSLKATQGQLVAAEKMAFLGQLTAGIAHEIKNPLNFVNNFAGSSAELLQELNEALQAPLSQLRESDREMILDLVEGLSEFQSKIKEHGERADGIVKNMLLHAREGPSTMCATDINALLEENLRLSYHSARAESEGFNISIERELDPKIGQIEVFPQELGRVILNLFSNAFYAMHEHQNKRGDEGYRPTLTVFSHDLGDEIEIRIRDNGTGIPDSVVDKIFNPFFTTKPAGEGTGLGLSLCYETVVQLHHGQFEVDTREGEFTEFLIRLPKGTR
jgi:GAF domain-containing protein